MRRAAVLVLLLPVLALTGCGPYAPEFLPLPGPTTSDELVGTWTHESAGETATIVLSGDGTVTYDNLPLWFIEGGSTSQAVGDLSGGGVWDFDPYRPDNLALMLYLDHGTVQAPVANGWPAGALVLSEEIDGVDSGARYRFLLD